MPDLFDQYWNLLSRKPTSTRSGFDAFPITSVYKVDAVSSLYVDTLHWAAIFSAICILIPIVLEFSCSNYWNSLVEDKEVKDKDGKVIKTVKDKSKQIELPSMVITLLHHLYVVPTAFLWIYQDFSVPDSDYSRVDPASKEALIAPFCLGYFLADTIFYVFPEMSKGRFEMLIHHVLFVSLVLSSLYGDGNICKFIPHLLISDITGILFNSCTIIKSLGVSSNHWLITLLETLFALFFLLFRSINMPLGFYFMYRDFNAESLGVARHVIAPICLLQWFWLSKILKRIVKKLFGKKKKE